LNGSRLPSSRFPTYHRSRAMIVLSYWQGTLQP